MEDLGFTPIHFDIETTGSTPGKHQILTIALLNFINGETHYWEIRHDEVLVIPKAMEVNQIDITEINSKERMSLEDVDIEFYEYIRTFDSQHRFTPLGRAVANFDTAMIRAWMPQTTEVIGFAHIELNSLIYLESIRRKTPYPIMKAQLMRRGKAYAANKTGLEEHHALFDVHLDAHIFSTLTGILPEWMAV